MRIILFCWQIFARHGGGQGIVLSFLGVNGLCSNWLDLTSCCSFCGGLWLLRADTCVWPYYLIIGEIRGSGCPLSIEQHAPQRSLGTWYSTELSKKADGHYIMPRSCDFFSGSRLTIVRSPLAGTQKMRRLVLRFYQRDSSRSLPRRWIKAVLPWDRHVAYVAYDDASPRDRLIQGVGNTFVMVFFAPVWLYAVRYILCSWLTDNEGSVALGLHYY